MTTMTHSIPRLARSPHHPAATALLVLCFWLLAAALVTATHLGLDPISPTGGAVATVAVLLFSAYGYSRLVAHQSGVTHALGVGIAWLALSIVAEMALTTRLGHGWFALLGSPQRPLLRNLFLFVWIFAPAVFARGEEV